VQSWPALRPRLLGWSWKCQEHAHSFFFLSCKQ
jgi:hypothetical protein